MSDHKNDNERPSLTAQRNALLAAKLAAEHVAECIASLVTLAKSAKRESVRRQSATDLIRIATQLPLSEELDPKAGADEKPKAELWLIDPKEAAEELARRAALRELERQAARKK